jgi:hypothetical protein
MYTMMLLQTADATESFGLWDRIMTFVDTPAPFSPFGEYLLVLFVLWYIARRANRPKPFDTQAQDVLDEKYAAGELSKNAYDKYRQQMTLRPKR